NGREPTACGNNPSAVSFDRSDHLDHASRDGWAVEDRSLSQPVLSCRSSLFSPARTFEIDLGQAPYTLRCSVSFCAQDSAPSSSYHAHHSPACIRSNAEAYADG